MQKIKDVYLLWLNVVPHIPRHARYTIGSRIENKVLDLLELAYAAYFSSRESKVEKISKCIFQTDILKYLVTVTWEGKIISHAQYQEMACKLDEVGRMFGGWRNNLGNPEKKNRTL